MFKRGVLIFSFGIAALMLGGGFAFARTPIAPPAGHVNDRAALLSETYRTSLEVELSEYEQATGNEIAILALPTLEGEPIENYAVAVFEEWGIGKEKEDNGLLLLIAKEDREMRIEVGYGLEPYITDGRAGRIIREEIAPYFAEGKYDEGVAAAVARIKEHLAGAPATPGEAEFDWRLAGDATAWILTTGFFLLQFVFGGLLHLMARSKSVLLGGGLGAGLGAGIGLLLGLSAALFLVPVLLFGVLGLIFDWIVSNYASERVKKGGRDIFWYGGGGFSGGSSGGFGGFGGGSSGGGGASGSW